MGYDHSAGVGHQRQSGHLAGIDRCFGCGATKEGFVADQPMALIQKQHQKRFVGQATDLELEPILNRLGRLEGGDLPRFGKQRSPGELHRRQKLRRLSQPHAWVACQCFGRS